MILSMLDDFVADNIFNIPELEQTPTLTLPVAWIPSNQQFSIFVLSKQTGW